MTGKAQVQWMEDYELGLEKASAQKKPILLDFFKEG